MLVKLIIDNKWPHDKRKLNNLQKIWSQHCLEKKSTNFPDCTRYRWWVSTQYVLSNTLRWCRQSMVPWDQSKVTFSITKEKQFPLATLHVYIWKKTNVLLYFFSGINNNFMWKKQQAVEYIHSSINTPSVANIARKNFLTFQSVLCLLWANHY